MSLPRIDSVGGRSRPVVDDRPFLILRLQRDCDSCFSKEEMNPLFPEARKMGANTAALPVYWREIEPFVSASPVGTPPSRWRADWVRFERTDFKLLHPMRRERLERDGLPVTPLEPGVARVLLVQPDP